MDGAFDPPLPLPPLVEPLRFGPGSAPLSGLWIAPPRPVAATVLHGATGVPMRFYRPFAEWLAATRGQAVLIYDYRDFGASARGSMRQSRATMADWGIADQAAALAELARRGGGLPLFVIGHSLGGLMLGFHPGMERVARIVTVASGLVHVTDHPPGFRLKARLFWHGMAPLARLLGYLPGRALGFGPDLPLGVYAEWRRWCLNRGGWLSDVGDRLPLPDPSRVRGRMRVVALADDALVPPAAVWRLMATYPAAVKRQRVLRPADFGLARIGHIAPFARANAAIWPELAP